MNLLKSKSKSASRKPGLFVLIAESPGLAPYVGTPRDHEAAMRVFTNVLKKSTPGTFRPDSATARLRVMSLADWSDILRARVAAAFLES